MNGDLGNREVTTDFKNPTDFDVQLKKIEILKTSVEDAFFEKGEVIFEKQNILVQPFKNIYFSLEDNMSSKSSVYWVKQDFVVESNFKSNVTKNYFIGIEIPNEKGYENSGRGGGKENEDETQTNENENFLIENFALIKKTTDKTVVKKDESVKVTVRIINSRNKILESLTVIDEVPENYKITNINKAVKVENGKIIYVIESIKPYATEVLEYELSSSEEDLPITFLLPVKLVKGDQEIFSQGVLLIRDKLSEAKVFVQKEVKSFDENFFEVILKVKNVQNNRINDLIVSQFIPNDVLVKDISKVFKKKGEWIIKTLGPNELWEVRFLIEKK